LWEIFVGKSRTTTLRASLEEIRTPKNLLAPTPMLIGVVFLAVDTWHKLYPGTPSFQSFNMATKGIVSSDKFNVNPINVSNILPWLLYKTNINFSLKQILQPQNPEIFERTARFLIRMKTISILSMCIPMFPKQLKKQEAEYTYSNSI